MPPTAGIVGWMLALASSAGLAGQTDQRAAAPGPPVAAHRNLGQAPSLEAANRQLSAALSPTPGGVRSAALQSSVSPEHTTESGQRPRHPADGTRRSGEAEPASLPPPGDDPPLRLSPPGKSGRRSKTGVARGARPPSWVTIASSLTLVLGLFLVVAWAMRRTLPGGIMLLPNDVVEVLGRAALAGKAQVHLVRCGSKLLLVSLSPTGVETLTEITDPNEVDRLAGLCRQAQPGSATAAFRQVLHQFAAPGGSGSSGMDGDDVGLANAGVPGRRFGRREERDV